MKTINEYIELKIPIYALSYLVNDDASGIEEKGVKLIDAYMKQYYDEARDCGGEVIFSPSDEEPSFTNSPEFGLACDCVSSPVLIVK